MKIIYPETSYSGAKSLLKNEWNVRYSAFIGSDEYKTAVRKDKRTTLIVRALAIISFLALGYAFWSVIHANGGELVIKIFVGIIVAVFTLALVEMLLCAIVGDAKRVDKMKIAFVKRLEEDGLYLRDVVELAEIDESTEIDVDKWGHITHALWGLESLNSNCTEISVSVKNTQEILLKGSVNGYSHDCCTIHVDDVEDFKKITAQTNAGIYDFSYIDDYFAAMKKRGGKV